MSKDLTYWMASFRQRMIRIGSIGIVAFVLMWIGVGLARFAGIDDHNTQQVISFFILACGSVWLFAILSAIVAAFENWTLKKIKRFEKDAE